MTNKYHKLKMMKMMLLMMI